MIIINKNKETGKWERISESEYVSDFIKNNKQQLTMEIIQKNNKLHKTVFKVIAIIALFFAFVPAIMTMDEIKNQNFSVIIIPAIFLIVGVSVSIVMYKQAKRAMKNEELIDNRNFKIIEDKIYDKYMSVSVDSDGDRTYNYYVFTKIYGKISADDTIYRCCKKNDSLYLLFCSENESADKCNFDEKKEHKRNDKNIEQKYLATIYTLSPELMPCFVPYNEALGDANFKNRIRVKLLEAQEKNNKVKCKSCGKKYNLKQEEKCPNCNAIYKFDIQDVIHQKEWHQ